MTVLVAAVFVSSLLGSLHCAGMCGPLVAAYAGMPGPEAPWRRRAAAHAAYSAGRLAAYVALGAVAGAFGSAIDRAAAWAEISRAAAIVSGAAIALWGLHALLSAWGARVGRLDAPPALRRLFGRAMRAAGERSSVARAAILGVGSALLPCGWLWAFVVTAAGTGSAPAGALVMAVFWAGTLPALLAVGEAIRGLTGPFRRHVPATCALVLVVLGVWTVVGRSRLGPFPQHASAASPPACHGSR